jgi:sortase A
MFTVTRLAVEFPVDLPPPDALVACGDAIDGMGWDVQSVESRRIVSATDSQRRGAPSRVEVLLKDLEEGRTTVRVVGANATSERERLRAEMFEVRDAIKAAAENTSVVRPSEAPPEQDPEVLDYLQQLRTKDRRWARVFRVLALALIVMSVIVLAEAGITLLWQEPLSYVYAKPEQNELAGRLDDIEAKYRRADRRRESTQVRRSPLTLSEEAARLARSTNAGEPLGRIRMPAIGLETVMVEDASSASLQKGPAHYAGTPLPGQPGTVGIAGHRTTYQAPFHDIDNLERGDRVVVRMPYGVFRYRIEGSNVVSPDNVQVLKRVDHDRLTMTACHPLYSASERIAVFARLVGEHGVEQSGRAADLHSSQPTPSLLASSPTSASNGCGSCARPLHPR